MQNVTNESCIGVKLVSQYVNGTILQPLLSISTNPRHYRFPFLRYLFRDKFFSQVINDSVLTAAAVVVLLCLLHVDQ